MSHGQDVCAHLVFFRLFVDNADQEMRGVHWKATKFSGSVYPQHKKRLLQNFLQQWWTVQADCSSFCSISQLTWNHYWKPCHYYWLCNNSMSQHWCNGSLDRQIVAKTGSGLLYLLVFVNCISTFFITFASKHSATQRMLTGQLSFVLSSHRNLNEEGCRLDDVLYSHSPYRSRRTKQCSSWQ